MTSSLQTVSTELQIEAQSKSLILPTRFVGTFAIGDTTPSVKNCERWIVQNASPLTITNFHDGQPGQSIKIRGDGQTTVQHGTNIFANTGANKLLLANQAYEFTLFGTTWIESAGAGGSIFTSPFGYGVGVGGTVTQLTSRGNDVTLNKLCGIITTNGTTLTVGSAAAFQFFNSFLESTDILIVLSGRATIAITGILVSSGSAFIEYYNLGPGNDSTPDTLRFLIIKASST